MSKRNTESIVSDRVSLLAVRELNTSLNYWRDLCHRQAKKQGWWNDLKTGKPLVRCPLGLLALVHSEISEAFLLCGSRRQDKLIPDYLAEYVELADIFIRMMDICGFYEVDFGSKRLQDCFYSSGGITSGDFCLFLHLSVSDLVEGFRRELPMDKVVLEKFFAMLYNSMDEKGDDFLVVVKSKLEYNLRRADHRVSVRLGVGGKKQ